MIEVEFALPFRVVVPLRPFRDEFVLDSIIRLNVVDHLNHALVNWFVEVDIRRNKRVLHRDEELEANRPSATLQLDGQLAS